LQSLQHWVSLPWQQIQAARLRQDPALKALSLPLVL
jgi:hypothetical protein